MGEISDSQLAGRFELVGSSLLKQRGKAALHPGKWAAAELPANISDLRGGLFWEEGATGVADTLTAIQKTSGDTYARYDVPLNPSITNATDVTAGIQAAIDAVAGTVGASTGGGTVFLPPGVFTVGTISLRQHVRLVGSGEGTVLKAKTNIGGPVLTNASQADRFITVESLRIDGNKANQSTGSNRHGIHFDLDDVSGDEYSDTYWKLDGVTVINCKDRGVFIEGRGEGYAGVIHVRDCNDVGFYLDAPDCGIHFIRVSGSGKQGIYIGQSNTVGTLCKAFYNGLLDGSVGYGIHVADGAIHTTLEACESQDNNHHGYFIQGDDTILSGIADSNNAGHGGDSDRNGNGVQIDGASGCIVDVTARDRNANTRRQKYALGMSNGADGLQARIRSSGNLTGHVQNGWHTNVDIAVNAYGGSQDVSYAASIPPNPTQGQLINVGTLTNGITINAPSAANTWTGQQLTFIFTQDATGGRTVTWNAAYKVASAPATTANAVGAISFVWNGTNYVQI